MFQYRLATVEDVPLLVRFRMDLLRSAVNERDEEKWHYVKEQTSLYYGEAIPAGTHIAYIASFGDRYIGTGGVCFYQVVPTYYKPTGKKAYIINMFTDPEFRRRGAF